MRLDKTIADEILRTLGYLVEPEALLEHTGVPIYFYALSLLERNSQGIKGFIDVDFLNTYLEKRYGRFTGCFISRIRTHGKIKPLFAGIILTEEEISLIDIQLMSSWGYNITHFGQAKAAIL